MAAPSVFISYSDADRSLAELLHDDLRRAGARVFQFSQTATIGTPSWTEILEKISAADVFVLLVTEAANASAPVQAELEHAYGSRINTKRPSKIIPAIVDKGVRPPTLAVGFVWLPFHEYESGLTRLLRELSLDRAPDQEELRPERAKLRLAYSEGRAAFDDREFALAVLKFQEALSLAPDFLPARNDLGSALHSLDRFDEAVATYRIVVELDSNYALGHVNLAMELVAIGEYEEARSSIEKGLQLAPADGRAHATLAYVLRGSGELDKAVGAAKRGRELAPNDSTTLDIFAAVMADAGEYESALSVIDAQLAEDPRNPEALAGRCWVLAGLGRFEESLESIDAALELKTNRAWTYNRGVALALLDRFSDAIDAIETAYEEGFSDFELADQHEYLGALRSDPTFGPQLRALIERYRGGQTKSPK